MSIETKLTWYRVDEKLPPDAEEVLIVHKYGYDHELVFAQHNAHFKKFYCANGYDTVSYHEVFMWAEVKDYPL
jgi:hypothetical protein